MNTPGIDYRTEPKRNGYVLFRLFAVVMITTTFVLPSCRLSPQNQNAELKMQKELWTAEMKDAFPEQTNDTVELRKRLEYYRQSGNRIGEQTMLQVLGNQARNSSQFRSAIENHTAALHIAYEIYDTIFITTLLNALGTDFRRIGTFEEAMKYHYMSLQLAEDYRGEDTTAISRNIASSYNGIGVIYSAMNEPDEAIQAYESALKIEIEKDNYRGMAMNYANIGSVWFDKGEYNKAEEYFNTSLEYNIKANLDIGIALCYINLGGVYEIRGNIDRALGQYLSAYDILAKTSDKWHWLKSCFHIGELYMNLGNYSKAESYLNEGLRTAIAIKSPGYIEQAYELLSRYDYGLGNYKRSVDGLRISQSWADTVRHNLEADRLLDSRVKYDTEKFSRQIEELDQLNREQRAQRKTTMLIMISVFAVLIALLLLVLYKRRLERRQAAELKNIERMRSNFFTNITHEFRTPITVINGLSTHLQSSIMDADSSEAKDLEAIHRQGVHLMNLVNQVLDFSRSEAGVNKPKWRYGNIIEYLQVISESYVQYAKSRDIELFVYSEVESLWMNFVPSSMKKVMGNLLSNAVKHCSEGDRIVVHFRCNPTTKRCFIQVKDSGEGIAAENLPHIFELYYTSGSHNAGSAGSGIGLALSKQLIEEIGGTITVASTLGKGAEFIVSLPISDAAISENEREELDEEDLETPNIDLDDGEDINTATDFADGRKTILIIEDNRDVAHYISTILADKYSLLYASNGNEGLLVAEQNIPDLIITDVMMPEKDGYAFTADLRSSIAISHIPIIMVTAKTTTEDKLEGLKVGADAYLPKPFDERELLVRIKQLLDSRAMLMDTYSNVLLQGGVKDRNADENHNIAFLTKLSALVSNHLDDSDYFPYGLASDICLSRSQLYRKLKAMTGHSIFSFVMRARLNKAKQMLSKRDKSISEVAFSCGFSDLSHFSRSFKEEFGYTPSQFIKIPEQRNP